MLFLSSPPAPTHTPFSPHLISFLLSLLVPSPPPLPPLPPLSPLLFLFIFFLFSRALYLVGCHRRSITTAKSIQVVCSDLDSRVSSPHAVLGINSEVQGNRIGFQMRGRSGCGILAKPQLHTKIEEGGKTGDGAQHSDGDRGIKRLLG